MPTFEHEGRWLHYLDEGDGPPVLLLHAFPLSSEMYRPQLEALGARYRFIVPDLRGFGQSDVDPHPVGMPDFADDALALLDHLGIDQAVVGGVSMGGYVALALLRTEPSRVAGLILSDTQFNADDDAGKRKREDVAQALEKDGIRVLEDSMPEKLLAQPPQPQVQARVRSLIREAKPQGAASASRGMGLRTDSRDILGRFAGPLLVIVGEGDVITPPQKAKAMADLVKGSVLETIPGAGHLPNLEQPSAFNAVLERFLAPLRP